MDLQEDLKKLQCPINWDLPSTLQAVEETRKKLLVKLESNLDEDDESSSWQRLCQLLVLATLEYRDHNVGSMGILLDKIDAMSKGNQDRFQTQHIPPIKYVKNGMQAFCFYKQKACVETESCLAGMKAFEELSNKDQAAVYAIKACCLMEFAAYSKHTSEDFIET